MKPFIICSIFFLGVCSLGHANDLLCYEKCKNMYSVNNLWPQDLCHQLLQDPSMIHSLVRRLKQSPQELSNFVYALSQDPHTTQSFMIVLTQQPATFAEFVYALSVSNKVLSCFDSALQRCAPANELFNRALQCDPQARQQLESARDFERYHNTPYITQCQPTILYQQVEPCPPQTSCEPVCKKNSRSTSISFFNYGVKLILLGAVGYGGYVAVKKIRDREHRYHP